MYAYAMLNPVLQMDLLGLDPVSTQRFLACLVRAAGQLKNA